MYKIALVVSTIPSFNVYRAMLERVFCSGVYSDFLICSGFFHERLNSRGPFYASAAFTGATLAAGSTVTVVGAYDPASTEFDDFVVNLNSALNVKGKGPVVVTKRRSVRKYANHWHAKIFIAQERGICRFAVVGSSNLTRSAFNSSACNNEADVIIWDDAHANTRQLVNSTFDAPLDGQAQNLPRPAVIVSNYNANDSRNSSRGAMRQRLKQLWDDVLMATAP